MSERDEFEAWAKRDGFGLERNHFGDYERIATRGAWDAWQAARATQAVPSLTPKAIKEMAWEAHNLAARIPGATPYNAAVFALEAVRDLLAAPQPSPEPKESR